MPMPHDKREPTQKLPKTGEEIPLPKREDVMRDLRKGARMRPAPQPKK
jgi:hypothetical protein